MPQAPATLPDVPDVAVVPGAPSPHLPTAGAVPFTVWLWPTGGVWKSRVPELGETEHTAQTRGQAYYLAIRQVSNYQTARKRVRAKHQPRSVDKSERPRGAEIRTLMSA